MAPRERADRENRGQRDHRHAREPQVERDHALAEERHVSEGNPDREHRRDAAGSQAEPFACMRSKEATEDVPREHRSERGTD